MQPQSNALLDFWPDDARWFIVGGTADGDEAQTVHAKYPDVRCIGFEPNREFANIQNSQLSFPGIVYPIALWSSNTDLDLVTPSGATARSASVCMHHGRPDVPNFVAGDTVRVPARSLDSLSSELGPFENVVLWIDIEGAETETLRGATSLLESGQIKLINLECFAHIQLPCINRLLSYYGFMLQKVWNIGMVAGRDAQDYIYALEG